MVDSIRNINFLEETMMSRYWKLAPLGLLAIALTGCPPKSQVKKDDKNIEDASANKHVDEPSLRGKEYKEVPELVAIYYDLDQSTLRSDARESLQRNYEILKSHPDWEVLVEGHCDERGTTEYNLGLGQKRASSVRQYYRTLGISGSRVATISYGKESPVCMDHNEDCWSKNRRGSTKVRINPDKQ